MVQLLTRWITRPARKVGCTTLIALCCCTVSGPTDAVGQTKQYASIPRMVKLDEARQLRKSISGMLRGGGSFSQSEETLLSRYYLGYIGVEMTQTDNVNGVQYPEWRREIIRDISAAGSPQKQAAIRNVVLSAFKRLAEDKERSPACRYNALLMLGELNDREQDRRAGQPPVPNTAARDVLLKMFNDPSESEAMRIGALIGLVRHNKLIVAVSPPEEKLLSAFRGVLGKSAPDQGGTAEGLEWMKVLAMEGLGDAGLVDDVRLLAPVLQDENAPELLRMSAYRSLGRLKFKNTDDIDEGALIQTAAAFTAKLIGQQVSETKTYIETNADEIRNMQRMTTVEGGTGTGTGGTAATPTPAVPENPYVSRVRQSIRYQLKVAELLLESIAPAVTEPAWRTARSSILSEVSSLLKALDSTSLQPQEFLDKIAPAQTRLEGILKNAAS